MSDNKLKDEKTLQTTFTDLLVIAKAIYGSSVYEYVKIYNDYYKGKHHHSISKEHPTVSRAEYFENKSDGDRLEMEAFMSRLKRSYYSYRQSIIKPGYLQILKEMIEAEIENDKNVSTNSGEQNKKEKPNG